MISLHYTSHTKAYNTIYTACNIVEAIYSFTIHHTWSFGSDATVLDDYALTTTTTTTIELLHACLK